MPKAKSIEKKKDTTLRFIHGDIICIKFKNMQNNDITVKDTCDKIIKKTKKSIITKKMNMVIT